MQKRASSVLAQKRANDPYYMGSEYIHDMHSSNESLGQISKAQIYGNIGINKIEAKGSSQK